MNMQSLTIKDADFVVKATHFEYCVLSRDVPKDISVQEISTGYLTTVGHITIAREKKPVCVCPCGSVSSTVASWPSMRTPPRWSIM